MRELAAGSQGLDGPAVGGMSTYFIGRGRLVPGADPGLEITIAPAGNGIDSGGSCSIVSKISPKKLQNIAG